MTTPPKEADPSAHVTPAKTFTRLDESNTLKLTGPFSVDNVAAIHAELSVLLPTPFGELIIDMGGITELDTAGLQLLVALRSSCDASRVHSCPENLREFIDRVGLTQLLI